MDERPTLTVYSRPDCHLCGEMVGALRRLQGTVRFQIEVIDVDCDPELRRRYGERVPVLMHGAVELCHYRLTPEAVTAYLAKAS